MALGAVQSGYAGAAYAYQRRSRTEEKFCADISSAARMTEGGSENDGKVIGQTMLPYGDGDNRYGMKAQYAAESTPEEPVIQVTTNYGGEWVSYKVNVNEVNPWDASQLEMFALLCYADDQGISEGGSFGSYHRLEVYADNAQTDGYWEGNESWEDFVDAKHDWLSVMNQVTDKYSRTGVYSQYINGCRLVNTLSHFSIRHVDFDSLKIVDKTEDVFSHYELGIPGDVWKAWLEALGELGDRIDTDMSSHLDSVMIRRFTKIREEDPAGDPIEAALRAAKEALQDLGRTLAPELGEIAGVQTELRNERALYQSFIRKLEKLQKEGSGEEKAGGTEEAERSGESGEAPEEADYMQLIRQRMEELFVLIQNGEEEASFQIGSSSFTVKEWEKFLENFDDIEDAIRELMRERIEKRTEEAEEIDVLVAESTKCTYPASAPGQEDTMYITWYTNEGIFCRKAGQGAGYEWSVLFENREDYRKVMEFLGGFDRGDNLRFAAHENFWQDFLKDGIDLEGFHEMVRMQEELIEANKADIYSRGQ